MAAVSININDLQYDDNTIQVNNINDLTGQLIQTCFFHEFIVLLENKLTFVCDMIIKLALLTIDTKYVIVGGKALNNIISKNNLTNSFNYDICVKDADDIVAISNKMLLGLILNNHWRKHYRRQIFDILLHSNLVDIPDVNDITTVGTILHYYMTDPLIYSGKKISKGDKQVGTPGIPTDGLFIKLVLKKELFTKNGQPYICSNERSEPLNNYIIPPSPLNPPLTGEYNIIYLPIANIINGEIHFGVVDLIEKELLYTNTFEKLKYAKYPLLVYNLIQNIIKDKLNNSGTYSKNVNKLKLLINMVQYNCQFLGDITEYILSNQVDEFATILAGLDDNPPMPKPYYKQIPYNIDLNKLKLYVNKSLIFIENTELVIIIRNFLIAYERIYNARKDICRTNLLLNHTATIPEFNTEILIDNVNIANTNLQLEALLGGTPPIPGLDNIDGRQYIKEYTDETIYKIINEYCNYISLGLDYNDIPDNLFMDANMLPRIWGGIIQGPNSRISKATIEYVCQGMDRVFDNVHRQYDVMGLYPLIKNTFVVYSFLELIALTSLNYYSLEIDYVKNGDIIQIGQYISSSYARNYQYQPFAKSERTLFKININKTNNNWIFIGDYSVINGEKEILIRRNSYFVVTGVTFETINIGNNEIEFRTISVDLCIDLQDAINNSQQIITKPLYVTDDLLFRTAAKYVYDNHLSNEYQDPNGAFEFQYSIERYNHALANSLREASYIMLLHVYRCLHDNKLVFANHNYLNITYNDILQLCIVVMFSVSGRESEAGFTDNKLLYNNYLKASSENFEIFALGLQLQIFTQDEIDYYKDLIINYKNNFENDYKAWLMCIAHDLDMTHVSPKDSREYNLEVCITPNHFTDIIRKSELILIGTGEQKLESRIHTLPYKAVDEGLFYKANTDINYCLNIINNILYQNINVPIIQPQPPAQQPPVQQPPAPVQQPPVQQPPVQQPPVQQPPGQKPPVQQPPGQKPPAPGQKPPAPGQKLQQQGQKPSTPGQEALTTLLIQFKYLTSIDIENLQFIKLQTDKSTSKQLTEYDKKLIDYDRQLSAFMENHSDVVKKTSVYYKSIQELKQKIVKDKYILQTKERNIKTFSNIIRSNPTQIDTSISEYKSLSLKIKESQERLGKLNIQYHKTKEDLEREFYREYKPKPIIQPTRQTHSNIMFTIRKQPAAFIIDPTKKSKDRQLLSNYRIFDTGLNAVVNTNTNTNTNNKRNCVCCCTELTVLTRINIYMHYMDILEKHNNKLIDTKLVTKLLEYNQKSDNYKNDYNYKKYIKYKNKYLQLKYL